jgi:outer membrane protein TolC
MYREGVISMKQVVDAQAELMRAQVEYARTVEEKIKLVSSQLKNTERFVQYAERAFTQGQVSVLDVHTAKSNKLALEIELLKLQRALKKANQK